MRLSQRLFVLVLLASSCQLSVDQTDVPPDNYPVYSAYLNRFHRNVPRQDTVIIGDATAINPLDIDPKTPWSWMASHSSQFYAEDTAQCQEVRSKAWEPLFEAMKRQFYQPRLKLHPEFTVSYPTLLVSREQLSQRAKLDEMPEIATHYVFTLSNIVYDSSQTRAMLCSSFVCGGSCGRGELVTLKKRRNRWLIISITRLWIA